jgi:hypothetical protein
MHIAIIFFPHTLIPSTFESEILSDVLSYIDQTINNFSSFRENYSTENNAGLLVQLYPSWNTTEPLTITLT